MNVRHTLTALGAGLTTGLLVAVLVIELLAFEFSALIGLPLGILAGLIVLATVAVAFNGLDEMERRAMSAYAAFGLTVIVFAALSYVNLARGLFSGTVAAGAGLVAAVLTYLGLWTMER
jgi:hypothetical protein